MQLDYEEYMKSRQDRTNKDRFQHLQPFSEMPGPRGLPMIGTLWDYMKKDGYTFGKMFEVGLQRIMISVLGVKMVIDGSSIEGSSNPHSTLTYNEDVILEKQPWFKLL